MQSPDSRGDTQRPRLVRCHSRGASSPTVGELNASGYIHLCICVASGTRRPRLECAEPWRVNVNGWRAHCNWIYPLVNLRVDPSGPPGGRTNSGGGNTAERRPKPRCESCEADHETPQNRMTVLQQNRCVCAELRLTVYCVITMTPTPHQ